MTRILIVDDEPSLRLVLRRMLEREGHDVLAAATGDEALEMLRLGGTVDVVLLDLSLGQESGLELLRVIRGAGHRMPVAIFTGRGTPESAIEAMKLGASDYVLKPLRAPQLRRLVVGLLAGAEGTEDPAEEPRNAPDPKGQMLPS